ncbi:MAG TPA: signal recognition particle receptor subunit alpha, partial [Mycobacterium sp.]|nr:signal recognition particle receptor subunit alpha [Mycobacterium sp.]
MSQGLWIAVAVIAALLVVALLTIGLARYRRRQISLSAGTSTPTIDRSGGYTPSSGITFGQTQAPPDAGADVLSAPAAPKLRADTDTDIQPAEPPAPPPAAPAPPEAIAPVEGRLERLRGRLSRSQTTLGRSMLGLLGGGDLDDDSWDEIEDTLLIADLGPTATASVVAALHARLATSTVRTEDDARAVLRDVLTAELQPGLDRAIRALPYDNHPSVLLV